MRLSLLILLAGCAASGDATNHNSGSGQPLEQDEPECNAEGVRCATGAARCRGYLWLCGDTRAPRGEPSGSRASTYNVCRWDLHWM